MQHAESALDRLIATVQPGARTGVLHATAVEALWPFALHPALGGSVGHSIGLSLNEHPEIRAGGDSTLVENGVYSLQVGIADAKGGHALTSAIVRSCAKGPEILIRSTGIAKS